MLPWTPFPLHFPLHPPHPIFYVSPFMPQIDVFDVSWPLILMLIESTWQISKIPSDHSCLKFLYIFLGFGKWKEVVWDPQLLDNLLWKFDMVKAWCLKWAVSHEPQRLLFFLSAYLSALLSFLLPFLMIFFQLSSLSLYFCLVMWRVIRAFCCPREVVKNNGWQAVFPREAMKTPSLALKSRVNRRWICVRFCVEKAGAWVTTTQAVGAALTLFVTLKMNSTCGLQPRKEQGTWCLLHSWSHP